MANDLERRKQAGENPGAIIRHTGTQSAAGGSTLILSGIARSGTSLLAQAVRAAGVYIGSKTDNVVFEDVEIASAMTSKDTARLDQIIETRNSTFPVWGFKRPHLHAIISPDGLARFRNPKLIVVYRDPVAIAGRNAVSELVPVWRNLRETMAAQAALFAFVEAANCPALLMSYEKMLIQPEQMMKLITAFADLEVTSAQHAAMVDAVAPDREVYRHHARRVFEGFIDRIRNGMLTGWARDASSDQPITLVLLVDGRRVGNFSANLMRNDLKAAGRGEGRHGFSVPVEAFMNTPDAVVEVLVEGRTFRLHNSGLTIGALLERGQAARPAEIRPEGSG